MPYADPEKRKEHARETYFRKKAEGSIDKEARVKAVLAYVDRNRDKVNEYRRKYWEANKERLNAKRKARQDAEYHKQAEQRRRDKMAVDPVAKAKRLESWRRSYENRREQCIQKVNEYVAKHPDKNREWKRTTSQRRRRCQGSYTTDQWMARYTFYAGRCAYCGVEVSLSEVHRDHVIPLKYGGLNFASNLVPACQTCNLTKATKRWLPQWLGQDTPRITMQES